VTAPRPTHRLLVHLCQDRRLDRLGPGTRRAARITAYAFAVALTGPQWLARAPKRPFRYATECPASQPVLTRRSAASGAKFAPVFAAGREHAAVGSAGRRPGLGWGRVNGERRQPGDLAVGMPASAGTGRAEPRTTCNAASRVAPLHGVSPSCDDPAGAQPGHQHPRPAATTQAAIARSDGVQHLSAVHSGSSGCSRSARRLNSWNPGSASCSLCAA